MDSDSSRRSRRKRSRTVVKGALLFLLFYIHQSNTFVFLRLDSSRVPLEEEAATRSPTNRAATGKFMGNTLFARDSLHGNCQGGKRGQGHKRRCRRT